MTLVHVDAAELRRRGEDELESLASTVRAEYRRGKEAHAEVVDCYLAIGEALSQARHILPSDQAFGAWFRSQEFGFNQQWAHVLRTGADHEDEVRAAVTSQLVTGKAVNFEKLVKQVSAGSGGGRSSRPSVEPVDWSNDDVTPETFSAIVIDPPWRYDNVATRGAAEDHYPTMSMDELRAMELPASDKSHLYLWVTNPFMAEGLGLCEQWGFTFKTIVTWCKPQIGMGNYFRSATEHVIFGVRGGLGTNANNIPTWFTADRQRHSQKPDCFYDIVERSSPGPYLEMFARRRTLNGNWHVWGNEV